jgi:hypothetical protein
MRSNGGENPLVLIYYIARAIGNEKIQDVCRMGQDVGRFQD